MNKCEFLKTKREHYSVCPTCFIVLSQCTIHDLPQSNSSCDRGETRAEHRGHKIRTGVVSVLLLLLMSCPLALVASFKQVS